MLTHLELGITANLEVHGNTLVNTGDMIEFNLPTQTAAKTEKNEKFDFFFNGQFLIKKIRHDFDFGDKKHKTHMTLVKDSLEESLDGPEDNFEPKPKKSPKPVEKLEDFYPNL